ncbi:MAG: N-acetylmuramoyl-L-alanine amidase [Treponema sp.]|jgi:N-acetylmuramoyl-L-alanine amidase|nr:N-acetylmuramoyl-L-alanine amidase [Treponema sp.]
MDKLMLCRPRKTQALFVLLVTLSSHTFAQSMSVHTLSLEEALVSLSSLGAGTAEFRWDPFFSSGTFTVGRHEASFASGRAGESGAVLMDHRDILNLPLPYTEQGNIRFPESFIREVRYTLLRNIEENRSRFRVAAIVIDPGHGGRDPGAIATHTVAGRTFTLIERDIVLDVSLRLHAKLAASFPDKQVLLTRDRDVTVSLEDRVNLANAIPMAENEVAIFVSVHTNASFNRNARGFEIFYLRPGYRREVIDLESAAGSEEVLWILNSMMEQTLATESILLANNILARLGQSVGHLKPNRGVKPAEWFVIRNARMPSVLVELAFKTNETDALLLESPSHLNLLTQALYNGISDFIAFFERSGALAGSQ